MAGTYGSNEYGSVGNMHFVRATVTDVTTGDTWATGLAKIMAWGFSSTGEDDAAPVYATAESGGTLTLKSAGTPSGYLWAMGF